MAGRKIAMIRSKPPETCAIRLTPHKSVGWRADGADIASLTSKY